MEVHAIFGLQFLLSLTVFSLAARWYVVPWLVKMPEREALMLLVLPHAFRHIGLAFLVPGVVANPLPGFFAATVAYGDLLSGLLALAALLALRGGWKLAVSLVWVFNVVGSADLLNALPRGEGVPDFGAAWYIPTFWVPVLLVTHALIYARLLPFSAKKRVAYAAVAAGGPLDDEEAVLARPVETS